jgi:alkylation response protein AidB-like acyl-CoA dehydrogenase
VLEEMSDLGWVQIAVPVDLGGAGGNLSHLGVLLEEVGRSALASPLRECATVLAILSVLLDRQGVDTDVLTRISAGSVVVLMLPADQNVVRARRVSDRFSVDSPPILVDWAQAAETIVCVAESNDGRILLLAVPADQRGVAVDQVVTFDNERSGSVSFDGAMADLVAEVSKRELDEMRALSSVLRIAEILGAGDAMQEMTISHIKSRVQFGHPIGSFQAVRHKCADMAMDLDGMRLTTYEALWRADQGFDFVRAAAAATIFGAAACERIAWTASQLHGGVGFMTDHLLHRHFLRTKAGQLRLGTQGEINRWAAKALLQKGADLSPFPKDSFRSVRVAVGDS